MTIRYDRLILAMLDDELEQFCRSWVEKKRGYIEVKRYGNAGDKGRDVVGFLTDKRHQGEWDNYQCKQYRASLDVNRGLLAVGKVLYWASKNDFTPPSRFFFVAPKGLAGKLLGLIDKPSEFKTALISNWANACSRRIIQGRVIQLDNALLGVINTFPFQNIHTITVDDMLADPAVKPLLIEQYGADPGKYPPAAVPITVQAEELPYIRALVEAYSEREKANFADHNAVLTHTSYGPELRMHRERYFEADGFQKFYRDNTSSAIIEEFRRDIRFGVNEKWREVAPDKLARINSVMAQAAVVVPGGPLSRYAYIPVKQGVCHHFVNEGELTWGAEP